MGARDTTCDTRAIVGAVWPEDFRIRTKIQVKLLRAEWDPNGVLSVMDDQSEEQAIPEGDQ